MIKRIFFILFLIIVFIVWLALISHAEPAPLDGKEIYKSKCQMCHAADGKGNAKIAPAMKVEPAKLNLTKKETLGKTDGELAKAIGNGVGKMKGFKGTTTEEEVFSVIKHFRSLAK